MYYKLKLYVTGQTTSSRLAIESLMKICNEKLPDRYELEIIDVLKEPELAEADKILATPTLVKQLPLPLRKIIGDLSATEKVMISLDILP